jgi:hypothetical protein
MGWDNPNDRHTPDGHLESWFRQQVRDILNLDTFTRDQKILEELRRLKKLDERH